MNVKGARAIVTGATSGIGLHTVRALLRGGASWVGMIGRGEEKLAATAQTLRGEQFEGQIVELLADVREQEALSQCFADFVGKAGGLDVAVNNAGVMRDGALVSFSFKGVTRYPLADWHATLDTNLKGVFFCCQLAAEQMFRKRCKGVIVNISSVSRQGRSGQVAYSASKGGVASLTLTLAQELAPLGIRCVAIAPGLVETPMAEKIPEDHRKQMLSRVAVGRMGRPEEIAHGVLFCVENDFFNGRILELDGGAFG